MKEKDARIPKPFQIQLVPGSFEMRQWYRDKHAENSPVTFMGRPELLNIISTRSASVGMGHVMTVPPPWIRLKGSLVGKGGRSDLRPWVKTFSAVPLAAAVEGALFWGVNGIKAEAVPCRRRKARIWRWNFMVLYLKKQIDYRQSDMPMVHPTS